MSDEYAKRLARAKEARRILRATQPVRRKIVASVWLNDRHLLELSCGHAVPLVCGAFDFAQCDECGKARARRAGVE